ncbi:MAG TPA: HNH endonuclease [Actinophytocola sp.]|uniref:HNH endonuclease n=1 Tax=Actinophytocola sp. TaxID=1872138 RepID=UPI002DDD0DCE|nr:HNH endonuclease [Actinophytocola sp.]HEV2778484.1 HNH endonuclease [Actinophytocola sp.]
MARRAGRPWRRFRRLVVETYGPWCCFGSACLLGDPFIDLSLPWSNPPPPGYYTVHHVVPLAHGGGLLDLDTARPAHYRCNSSQQDRPMVMSRRSSTAW